MPIRAWLLTEELRARVLAAEEDAAGVDFPVERRADGLVSWRCPVATKVKSPGYWTRARRHT